MKRSDPQMRIRVPVDVKNWLEKEAARNMRTQNAELVMAVRAKMATTGSEFGDRNPVEAGNSTDQEINDAANT